MQDARDYQGAFVKGEYTAQALCMTDALYIQNTGTILRFTKDPTLWGEKNGPIKNADMETSGRSVYRLHLWGPNRLCRLEKNVRPHPRSQDSVRITNTIILALYHK